MTRRAKAAGVCAIAIGAALSGGRVVSAQARPPLMPAGTGSISGRVMAGDTGQPIAGAVVEIVIYENISSRFKQVLTDTRGRFLFPDLPPGHFQIQATAARYLAMHFGQLEPGPVGLLNPSRTIQLDDKQQFAEANFTLQRYSAIEGTVVDEMGDPAPNVTIQVSQVVVAGGMRRLMPVNASRDAGPVKPTDDLGHYRIGGLPPGQYYVVALAGAFANPTASGGFAITYYPGTVEVASARELKVPAGKDLTDISFALVPARTAVLGGTLVDETGAPIGGGTVMMLPSAAGGGKSLFAMIRAASAADGTFAFRNVPPGTYTIQAFGRPISDAGNLGAFTFGYLTTRVGDADTSHLTLRIPAPRSLRGHITFEGEAAPTLKPGNVQIATRPVEFESAPTGGGPSPYTVHDDWTFEARAMSGRRLVSVAAPGWFTKSVQLRGQDVTDTPLDFREADVDGVEIVLTQRTTTVTATLTVPEGAKPSDYNLLVFSTDPARWTIWSRYVATARPNQQGTFVLRGLPPGAYLAVALGSLAGGEWQDPDYLAELRDSGTAIPFTLGEAQSTAIQIAVKK